MSAVNRIRAVFGSQTLLSMSHLSPSDTRLWPSRTAPFLLGGSAGWLLLLSCRRIPWVKPAKNTRTSHGFIVYLGYRLIGAVWIRIRLGGQGGDRRRRLVREFARGPVENR